MTRSEAEARLAVELLYVEVEFGKFPGPTLPDYADNVRSLSTLSRHAEHLARTVLDQGRTDYKEEDVDYLGLTDPGSGHEPYRRISSPGTLYILRTTMASPWITILGEIARTTAPIGYGFAALHGLHRTLRMIMDWQQHRLDIEQRRRGLEHSHRDFLQSMLQTEGDRFRSELAQAADSGPLTPDNRSYPSFDTVSAALDLNTIRSTELLNQDGQRVSDTDQS